MARIAAVTGATGFIGREVLSQLLQQGWQVRALTRRAAAGQPGHPRLTWITGTLADPAALTTLVAGADVVIHLAGAVKAKARSAFFEANAVGVGAMVDATRSAAPSAHFLLISSLAARAPYLSPYAASKAAGEAMLHENGQGLAWTILRPPAVYGPGDMEILKIFRSLKFNLGLLPGGAAHRFSLVHVRDLSAGIIATIGLKAAYGGLFHVDDGREDGYTLHELLALGARLLDRSPRYVRVPRLALMLAAGVNQGISRLTGHAPMLTFGKVRELYHGDWVSDGVGISSLCGWRSEIGVETGLRQTLEWYRARGLI